MGEDANLNLSAWFRKLLQDRKFESLTWINESEQVFKVPWSNQKKRQWLPCGDDSKLLIEWAQHKYGYRQGQEEQLPKWKTNLRCAINKCPDIERIKDKDTDSYMACQFKLHHPVRTDSTLSSCSGTSLSDMDYACASSVSSSAMSEVDYFHSDSNNVPTVVLDTEMSSLSNDSYSEAELVGNTEFFSNTQEPLLDNNSDFNTCKLQVNNENCFNTYGPLSREITTNNSTYFHAESNVNVPSVDPINRCQAAIENNQLENMAQILPVEQEDEKQIMIIEALYDIPQRPVMSLSIEAQYPHLKIFSELVTDTRLQSKMYHPGEFLISLPSLEAVADLPNSNRDKISEVLKNFTRGVNVHYVDHNILVERKSKVKIFATDEKKWCNEIKRKQNSSDPDIIVKVFDYLNFLEELEQHFKDRSIPCPKDYVLLTIGHHCRLDQPSPLSTVLVVIKIRHVKAANDLKRLSIGSDIPPDPMISGGDSLDRQLELLKLEM
ncbi:uncharacterized protein LOC106057527 [Biomphalaria glabrata]|uniref:Uncharacterized protein LOC106057527 n=1 Tax=Biomphalaria glabrata TaxID=6526 RepID=A0A9U8E2P4_BIOGL|nr:uncharacterized protein LOC106057527 [Biomphalaria glabrata]XP_013070216.2 uncharacterized protein LOC106057527 [Biomphalaria glabrata]